jgi:hypothetical protein
MATTEHPGGFDRTYDRALFVAFAHYYIPSDENYIETSFQPILQVTPPTFLNLAEAFKGNFAAVASTACMPFRMASVNHGRRVYQQLLTAEHIRALKPEYKDQSEAKRVTMATNAATKKFSEMMSSEEQRYKGGLLILSDLGNLLCDDEMKLAAAELMRQAEVLAWGTLEVLANDLFIDLLNKEPQITETLLKDERTKKRFQMKDIGSLLSTYAYDLSGHMGTVLAAATKIDDVETLRATYEVLMPNNSKLLTALRDTELWKLNQRRNLILHRRSIVDELYLRNAGDTLKLGDELKVSPAQFEKDLSLVLRIGSAMLDGLGSVA